MAVRAVLMPLSLRALRGQAAAARLAPQLQGLHRQYAKQPERLQREIAALYQRESTSMLAGFTPLLLQWPLLSVMYLLFRSAQVGGKPNTLLSRDLFGVPLGSHWLAGAGPASMHGLVFLGFFAVLATLCWLSVRLGQRMAAAAPAPAAGAGAARALVRALPFLTVVIAAFVPLAAGIYLLASTGWALAERAFFWRTGRIGGAEPSPPVPAAASPLRRDQGAQQPGRR
jgi:YidC/Oxa1 family membrane protein insertase